MAVTEAVHVLGCGAIGTAVTGRLHLAGVPVVSVDEWAPHVETLRAGEVELAAPDHQGARIPAHTSLTLDEWRKRKDSVRYCVLAGKSDATERYLDVLAGVLEPDGVVASFQNGFNEPTIADAVGAGRTAGAIVLMDAALEGPSRVRQHRTEQRVVVGPWTELAAPATRAFVEVVRHGLHVDWSDTIRDQVSAKLLRNCVFNGVCAVTDRTIGELTADDDLLDAALMLAMEAARVLRASSFEPDRALTFGLSIDELIDADHPTESMRAAVRRTHPPDLSAAPSTLQDLRQSRPTEIDFLSGWVATQGRRLGIDVPLTARVVQLVHEMERGERSRGEEGLRTVLHAKQQLMAAGL